MKKAFVSMLEMITTVVVLFAVFGIFFSEFSYKSRWSEALLLLKERDIVLTLDRIGKLYNHSFDKNLMENFLNSITTFGTVPWTETDGTIKNRVLIACNCTSEQMNNITSWFSDLRINDRKIELGGILPDRTEVSGMCYTNLDVVNPCIRSSDVLLIWGQSKNLDSYKNTIADFIKTTDGGVIEVMNIGEIDTVQSEIFGLGSAAWGAPAYDVVNQPSNAFASTYQAYKTYVNGLKGNTTVEEFCRNTAGKIVPSDNDWSKVFVQTNEASPGACIVFNSSRVAWMSQPTSFTTNHTKLFTSVLLAVSNKKTSQVLIPTFKIGYATSYVNIENKDMYEVYKLTLGMGYPF